MCYADGMPLTEKHSCIQKTFVRIVAHVVDNTTFVISFAQKDIETLRDKRIKRFLFQAIPVIKCTARNGQVNPVIV